MVRQSLVLAPILALALLLAGCMSNDAAPAQAANVASDAQAAGAVDGPAPAAAKDAYLATAGEQTVTVYPVAIETNAAKVPYSDHFEGAFATQECLPTGGGLPLGGFGLARGSKAFPLTEQFAQNDVFRYEVTMTFENTDQSWAELHLWNQFDSAGNYWNEPTSEGRGPVTLNFTGQGFIVNEEFFAGVGVDCWFGQVTTPIPFTIDVVITYAEGAVPSAQPVLLRVPEGATTLYANGLAVDASKPVTSHFRVFAPDDKLVCECSLQSREEVASLALPEPGDYVLLVDHAENGFLTFGLDAPASAPLRPLGSKQEAFVVASSDGGSVDETVQIVLNSTPLNVGSWVFAPGDVTTPNAGLGHNVKLQLSNARGDVLRMGLVGYGTYHGSVPGIFTTNDWYAIPIEGDWEFFQDHHAYTLGAHTVHVSAEQLRGDVVLFAAFYDRAS
ncbi:MAG TPA: hypothetical protein VM370_05555 [Candidatus Thermoplasmatota archaeon]|nr:hypothetical protein [Candidatus Thermoplasmatota archaeon]